MFGGVTPPEADYLEIGELLATALRCDFTFLPPEVLRERCAVRGGRLHLDNPHNFEEYRVVVLPGSETVSAGSLAKLRQFWEQGGAVVGTTRLPGRAAEFGGDAALQADIEALFGPEPGTAAHVSAGGGRAYFLPAPDAASLSAALDDALPVRDFQIDAPGTLTGGNFGCLHKVIEEDSKRTDVYFLANASDTPVDAALQVRGTMELERWDPQTGQQSAHPASAATQDGTATTACRVVLPPVSLVFLIGRGVILP